MKTPEEIFHIRLRVLQLSSSLIIKKHLYASFSFSSSKIKLYFVHLFCCFRPPHVVLLNTQKSRRAEKKSHNARSLQENNAHSAANQSAGTIAAI